MASVIIKLGRNICGATQVPVKAPLFYLLKKAAIIYMSIVGTRFLMKVAFKKSITFKVLKRINSLPGDVVLRSDIANLADPREVSRALNRLVQSGRLAKLGYGVYAKLARSEIAQTTYLKEGVLPTMRAALNRLNVSWEASPEEQDYQAGRSTQIPVNPTTKLKDRFRRQLRYRDMELIRG